jgi:hypothetical protein
MKKLLTIILALIIVISVFSGNRPPIVTYTISTHDFIWQGDTIKKDSLIYFDYINDTIYKYKRPGAKEWDTLYVDPSCINELDSFYLAYKNIWLNNRDTISEDDSLWMFRPQPGCPGCFEYKGVTEGASKWAYFGCNDWKYSYLFVAKDAEKILDIVENDQSLHDSIHFVIDTMSGKTTIIQDGDSVYWGTLPSNDSLFNTYDERWLRLNGTDSIYHPDTNDSLFNTYDERWLRLDGTDSIYHPASTDSSKWALDTYGIHNKSGNVGINTNSTSDYALNVDEGVSIYSINQSGIDIVSENKNAIWAQAINDITIMATGGHDITIYALNEDTTAISAFSRNGIGIRGLSFYDNGTEGESDSGYGIYGKSGRNYSGYFEKGAEGKGLFTDKFTINSMIYPIADGDSTEAIITDGAGHLSWGDPSRWELDTYGMHNKVQNVGINTFSSPNAALNIHGRLKLNILNSTPPGQLEVYSEADSLMGGAFYSSDQYAVGAYSTDNFGVYGWSDHSTGLVGWSEDSTGVAGYSTNGWAGYFAKNQTGKGLYTDELVVSTMIYPVADGDSLDVISTDGAGNLGFRKLGTMSNFNFWYGTQAEWTANTPHDGIYPQATTTYWNIKD